MKKLVIINVILILGLLLVPAVSAYDYEETISESTVGYVYPVSSSEFTGTKDREFSQFGIRYIENCRDIILIKFNPQNKSVSVPETTQSFEVEFHIDSSTGPVVGRGKYQTWRTDPLNSNGMCQIDFLEWDVDAYTGSHQIFMTKTTGTWASNGGYTSYTPNDINHQIEWQDRGDVWGKARVILDVYYRDEFKHYYNIDEIGGIYYVNIQKTVDGKAYGSTVYLRDGDNILMDEPEHTATDISRLLTKAPITLDIYGGNNKWYNRTFYTDTPVDPPPTDQLYPVRVDVESAATGAKISNAQLGVREYENTTWIRNETLTYGWTQFYLPAGDYEFFVTATGYTQPFPGRLTVDGVDDNIVLLLYPVTPPPEAGNVTLQVWANYGTTGSGQRYSVPGAEINILGLAGEGAGFDSGILTANNQGLVVIDVPGNSTYSAYASKTGYTSGETEFSVTTASPVHVSVELTPTGGLPTYPVTVYAQSSATGALVSNVNLGIRLYGNENWLHNETLTYGWTQVLLPEGNYEFFVDATGYTQPSPGRLTVDGVDDNIVLLLYPMTPPPSAGNVTLKIWANYGVTGSGQRYSVPGAEINILGLSGEGAGFDSGILTANDQGMVILEVPGNTSYSAYASKSGYTSGETEFIVTTVSPVHVSVALEKLALPTEPPVTPSVPPTTPTPAETPGEGFISQVANAFAVFLGVPYTTGKTALGMVIASAVGFTTAKQLRGGAPEFGVGLLAGAGLATLIGLLPVWLFVVLILVVGMLIGYKYMQGGQ